MISNEIVDSTVRKSNIVWSSFEQTSKIVSPHFEKLPSHFGQGSRDQTKKKVC